MTSHVGEWAALATSVCWSASAVFFGVASRRVGSLVINRTRLVLASIFLVTTHVLVFRSIIPLDAPPERWFWLGLSGIIGLTLGDALLFQAFIDIGPRLGMLLLSTSPVLSALLAWAFLGEGISWMAWAGILVTVGGVVWVVLGRDRSEASAPIPRYAQGIGFALGSAACQAIGLILSKQGLVGDYPALSGVVIRMLTATAAILLLTILQGQARSTVDRLRQDPRMLFPAFAGSIVGPFLGVWLSLVAVQRAQVGIASTLMALPPVFLVPVGWIVFKERFGWQAIAGTLVAIIGVAMLFIL